MKLIFLINKNNDYAGLSNIINYALKKKHNITCIHNYGFYRTGNRKHHFPSIKKSPFYKKIKIIKLDFKKNLINEICKYNFDQIFSRTLPIENLNNKFLDKIRKKFNIIMDSTDIYDVVEKIKYFPNCKIRIFCWSEFFRKKIIDYLREDHLESFKLIKNRNCNIFAVGHCYRIYPSNKKVKRKIKEELNIPIEKKIILYIPYAYDENNVTTFKKKIWKFIFCGLNIDYFREIKNPILNNFLNTLKKTYYITRIIFFYPNMLYLFNKKNENYIINKIKNFCEKNNYYFIVKGRKKFPIHNNVYKIADKIYSDKQTYNFPSLLDKLMQISDICVSYSSNINFLANLYNLKVINIKTHKDDWLHSKHFRYWGYNNIYFQNYKSFLISLNPDDFKIDIKSKSQKDFAHYRKRFIGENNFNKKIFDIIKQNKL
jgi:hypothetical protein